MLTLCVWLLASVLHVQAQIADIATYQERIHTAERQLIGGDKAAALETYYGVLTESDGNFIKDVHNGLIVATELGRADTFFLLLNLVVGKGLTSEYLRTLQPFITHHSDPRWQRFLMKNEEALVTDNPLRDTLRQLKEADQHLRLLPGSYSMYGDTIAYIDSINMDVVLDLIAGDRFPGETTGGVSDMYGTQATDILLHHYTQTTSLNPEKPKITSILVDLVRQGKLMPNKAALWLGLQNDGLLLGGNQIFQFSVGGRISDPYVPAYTDLQQKIIEQNRAWLHMEPLTDYYEVVKYVISYPDHPYTFDVQRQVFEITAATLDEWTEQLNQLTLDGAAEESDRE